MSCRVIFGGTFDPVHCGHLRMALELIETLALEQLHLLPCGEPPHRPPTLFTSQQRLDMLRLAVADEPRLVIDRREIERPGLSYMVDTLADVRAEIGRHMPLVLVTGTDAFAGLDRWHQWEKIPELAHLLVVARPAAELPLDGTMTHFLHAREMPLSAVHDAPAGRVFRVDQTLLDISSNQIRDLLARGQSPRYLVPDSVCSYIERAIDKQSNLKQEIKN